QGPSSGHRGTLCHASTPIATHLSMVAHWDIPGRGGGPWTVHVRLDMSGRIHSGRCDGDKGKSHTSPKEDSELLGSTEVCPCSLRFHSQRIIIRCVVLRLRERVPDRSGRLRPRTLCCHNS